MKGNMVRYRVEWSDIELGREVEKTQFITMAEGCTAQDAANVVAKLNGRYDLLCIVYTMLDDGYRWSTCGQYFGHGVDERKQNMMHKWLGGEK